MVERTDPTPRPTDDARIGARRRDVDMTAGPTDEPFRRRLRHSARAVDLLALLAVPIVLVAVARLTAGTPLSFAFSYADPTLRTAFESHFVRAGTEHLAFNLATCALVVPTAYLPSVLAGNRDRFYVAFVSFLVAFPVVLSLLNLAVPREGLSLGFSGVNMAFVGYLPVALAGYLRATLGVTAERDPASGLFFAGLALVAILSARTRLTYAVAAVAVVAHLRAAGLGVPGSWDWLGPAGYADPAIVGTTLLAGGLLGGFPAELAVDGAVINVYVHFVGFALGFLSTYLTVQVAPATECSPPVAAVRDLAAAAVPGAARRPRH
jgi:hypothetical protein